MLSDSISKVSKHLTDSIEKNKDLYPNSIIDDLQAIIERLNQVKADAENCKAEQIVRKLAEM